MDYGVVVDVETTGLDSSKDVIIELGFLEFVVLDRGVDHALVQATSGHLGSRLVISSAYCGLEDPGEPISTEISELTGLSDAVLADQKIDWEMVRAVMQRASIVIAHNADFDRKFLMARPELQGVNCHWGCSVRHIDWRKHGATSRRLQHLAADMGFVNPFAHRALFDCATTLRVVGPYLDELVRRSYEKEYYLVVSDTPFEMKDKLKSLGYMWSPVERVWGKTVFASELEAENALLKTEVLSNGRGQVKMEERFENN